MTPEEVKDKTHDLVGVLMRDWIKAIALCSLGGCATTVDPIPVQYRFVDHPEESRIELRYQNQSNKAVCLSPAHWPNAAGKVDTASDRVFLVVAVERFPIEDFNTGYCPGHECAQRVAPGEQISGSIPYSDFRLPERFENEPKTLEFSPIAFVCR